MENIRMRARKDVESTAQYATQKFAKDLLVVADTLTLALNSVPLQVREDKENHKHVCDLYAGVTMIENELLHTFKRHGLEKQVPLDQPFDPNMHEALYQAAIPGKTPGTIISVEKPGYSLHGRVIRPSKVGVAKEI
jgi:molecular chaperone GrpE